MDPHRKTIKLSDAAIKRSLLVLFETHYVSVRSRSLESSETVSDVTCTIHPYYFSSMPMELGWTTTMTRCALMHSSQTVHHDRWRQTLPLRESVFPVS